MRNALILEPRPPGPGERDGRTRETQDLSWLGDPTGRWEGNVLVVETSNYRPGLTKGADCLARSPQTRIVERFTRTSPTEIHCEFTVTDPYLHTRPIRGEYVFGPTTALFEYACHEGDCSIVNILTAARLGLQAMPEEKPPERLCLDQAAVAARMPLAMALMPTTAS